MVILIWGTIYQSEYGIYKASTKFFNSYFVLIFGFIPFPAVKLISFLLLINLIFSMIFKLRWKLSNTGNILIHIGLLILFLSGFYISYEKVETMIGIKEGDMTNVSQYYDKWELAFVGEKRDFMYLFDVSDLDYNQEYVIEELKLRFKMSEKYENSEPVINSYNKIISLKMKKPEENPYNNKPGIVLKFYNNSLEKKITIYSGNEYPVFTDIFNKKLFIFLKRKEYKLPFKLKLENFDVKFYPDTKIAKSYKSYVKVYRDNIDFDFLISMNKPLQIDDITIYQSSYFFDKFGNEYSIFQVVKNKGKYLPYLASIVISIGVLLHFFIIYIIRRKKS